MRLKTTSHFDDRNREREIKLEWCERVVRAPLQEEEQDNGYYRFWGYIIEEEKYLRVVTLEDRETIKTAHWDRNYKKRRR